MTFRATVDTALQFFPSTGVLGSSHGTDSEMIRHPSLVLTVPFVLVIFGVNKTNIFLFPFEYANIFIAVIVQQCNTRLVRTTAYFSCRRQRTNSVCLKKVSSELLSTSF